MWKILLFCIPLTNVTGLFDIVDIDAFVMIPYKEHYHQFYIYSKLLKSPKVNITECVINHILWGKSFGEIESRASHFKAQTNTRIGVKTLNIIHLFTAFQ